MSAVRDETIGTWVGFFRDEHTTLLCDALLEALPGARDYEHIGTRRRGVPVHGAPHVRP